MLPSAVLISIRLVPPGRTSNAVYRGEFFGLSRHIHFSSFSFCVQASKALVRDAVNILRIWRLFQGAVVASPCVSFLTLRLIEKPGLGLRCLAPGCLMLFLPLRQVSLPWIPVILGPASAHAAVVVFRHTGVDQVDSSAAARLAES